MVLAEYWGQSIACLCQKVIIANQLDGVISMYLELKGGWAGGSQTSILILFILGIYRAFSGVKLFSNSAQPIQRYCNLQTRSKVSMENLYFGNPSHLMRKPSHIKSKALLL